MIKKCHGKQKNNKSSWVLCVQHATCQISASFGIFRVGIPVPGFLTNYNNRNLGISNYLNLHVASLTVNLTLGIQSYCQRMMKGCPITSPEQYLGSMKPFSGSVRQDTPHPNPPQHVPSQRIDFPCKSRNSKLLDD